MTVLRPIPATIPALEALAPTSAPPSGRRTLALWLGVALAILGLPVIVFWVTLRVYHGIGAPPETASTRRLHVIGDALHAFAQDHGGAYPTTLADLAAAQHLPADLPTCPTDAPGGPFAYEYHGAGLGEGTAANGTVLAYEPPAANGDRGSHLLYADGTVVWVAAPNLENELFRGRPPERPQDR